MSDIRLRHAIAFEAARLMYDRQETEYFTAKRKAAKRIGRGWIKPKDLPSNSEIRDLVQSFARIHEGDTRQDSLKQMRLDALRLMRLMRRYKPRLIGSVMTGHIRKGSDIDLHLFSDFIEPITEILANEDFRYEVERKQVVKHNVARVFTHIHVTDRFNFELTVYAENQAHYVFKSSITGKAIERASILELEELIASEYPDTSIDEASLDFGEDEPLEDPFPFFKLLLAPLEKVKQGSRHHPEGDVLYHLLQVYELARNARPYDEEFLLAALLHDVGKGIDRYDHVASGLEALDGLITERTKFLIENHMLAHDLKAGTIGHRTKMRLEASEDFEDLMLLEECDSGGRVAGARVGTLDDALAYIKRLADENG